MRITNQMVTDRMLAEVQTGRQRLFQTQQRVSTGRLLNQPSDDPTSVRQLLLYREEMGRTDQYLRNLDTVHSDLSATESGIASMGDILARASELAVQAANASAGASDRTAISLEVNRLVDQAVSVANTSYGGRYIFAGHKTDTIPFVPDVPGAATTVTYQGDAGAVQREIGQGDYLTVNVAGSSAFPQVFQRLIQFRDDLQTNNIAGIRGAVTSLSNSTDAMLQLRSDVGARMRRADDAGARLNGQSALLQSMASGLETADVADSIVHLQTQETALQAALGAAGRALNLNLMDFLR